MRPRLLLALGLAACSVLKRPAPIGPDPDLVALAAHLTDEAGDGELCARFAGRAAEPAFSAALAARLLDARTAPPTWLACVQELQRGPSQPALLRALAPVYLHLLGDAAPEPRRQAQLAAAHAALWDRPSAWVLSAEERRALVAQLPAGSALAADARGAAEMEEGRYQGAPVGAAALEAVPEDALRRLALRLPDPQRQSARRALVRRRVAAQPALAAAGDRLVEAVVARGTNPVALEGLQRVALDGVSLAAITVKQDLEQQRARLELDGRRLLIPLRGALRVWLEDASDPITMCGDPAELDPSPCVAPEALALGNHLASYHPRRQALGVGPEIAAGELPALAAAGALDLGLTVGGQAVELRWPVRFERPADLVLTGAGRGPDLIVEAVAAPERPIVFRTRLGQHERVVVVERAELAQFHLVSRGARGAPGLPGRRGTDGEEGQDGIDERCGPRGYPSPAERGGDGRPGENGGPGGPGGHGGFIRVRLSCPADDCEAVATTLRAVVRSEGGEGGPGGAGGRGGAGGMGGVFGHCIDSSRNSMEGRADAGKEGPAGRAGPSGRAGLAGSVSVELAH